MSTARLLFLIAVVLLVLALLSVLGVVLKGAALALLIVAALCAVVGFALTR